MNGGNCRCTPKLKHLIKLVFYSHFIINIKIIKYKVISKANEKIGNINEENRSIYKLILMKVKVNDQL